MQARKVAARWVRAQIQAGWRPKIPVALERLSYVPDTPELKMLDEARDSVDVMIPRVLELLRKQQGDRYFANITEGKGRIFYFFSPRQPIDSFSLALHVKGGRAFLAMSYTPYRLDGTLDLRNIVNESVTSEAEMAGLALMRLVRQLLTKIP